MIETVELMKSLPNDDPFWQSILDLGLYTLPNPAQFPAVLDRWRLGTPDAWTESSIDGLVAMVERLVELAGEEVVGVSLGASRCLLDRLQPALTVPGGP
jgi:NitT/TauT family transport system substrate-binding protein